MLAFAQDLVAKGSGFRFQSGGTPVEHAGGKPLISRVLAHRALKAVLRIDRGDSRIGGIGQREEPPRHQAVLLGAVDLHGAVTGGAAPAVALLGIARIDKGPAVEQQIE